MPVVGTLAGAALGAGAAWLTERARWRREVSVRWDQTTRELVAALLAAVGRLYEEAHDAAFIFLDADTSKPITAPQQEALDRLSAAFDHAAQVLNELEVVAPAEILQALSPFRELSKDMFHLASEDAHPLKDERWSEIGRRLSGARADFVDAARRSLAHRS